MSSDPSFYVELSKLEIPNAIRFSPDAQKVLYSTTLTWGAYAGKRAVSTLWLASTGQAESANKLTSGEYKDYSPGWTPDGKNVTFISDRAEPGANWAIYTLGLDEDSKPRAVTPTQNSAYISAYAFSPDGRKVAYLAADEDSETEQARAINGEFVHVWGEDWSYARLRVVDLATNTTKTLNLDRHITCLSWSEDGTQIAFVSCETPDLESPFIKGTTLSIVDSDLKSAKQLCHFPGPMKDLIWALENHLFFVSGVAPERGCTCYCVYSVHVHGESAVYEKGTFGTQSDVHVDGLVITNNRQLVASMEDRLEGKVTQSNGYVLYSRKQNLEAFHVAYDESSKRLITAVATSNVNQPVEVFTTPEKSNRLTCLSNHGSKFASRDFGNCKFLVSPSFDGQVDLDSVFLTPPASVSTVTPFPTVVMIHGGPSTRQTDAFNTLYYMITPYLLSLGYACLMTNYRGSSGRGDPFVLYDVGGAGEVDYSDVIAATHYAITRQLIDEKRLICFGLSHGGFLSNLCAVRNGMHGFGWKFNAVISAASVGDVDSFNITSDMGSVYMPELHKGAVAWKMSKSDLTTRRGSAIWEIADAVRRTKETGEWIVPPVLLLHGEEDIRCHISNAWGMRRALQAHDLPFEFASHPRQGHFYTEIKMWHDMMRRIERWCTKYAPLR